MTRFRPVFAVALFAYVSALTACNTEPSPPAKRWKQSCILPFDIDGTLLWVPGIWGAVRLTDARPWPNGLRGRSGGWAPDEPTAGPLELACLNLNGAKAFKSRTTGLKADDRDPFVSFTFTFEFPQPAKDSDPNASNYGFDEATLAYRAPQQKPLPYIALFSELKPNDGRDVGSGWREFVKPFKNEQVRLRFDATRWRAEGGQQPTRMAASSGSDLWYHFVRLKPTGWGIDFYSEKLPLAAWNAKYDTCEQLFLWLTTAPDKRPTRARFNWWTDARLRPHQPFR